MSDIFLSYASEDRERVRPLVVALIAAGWSVFWDRIIPVGKTWHEILEAELGAARSIMVIWSHHAIKSRWVREEVDEGAALGLPFFPVLLDQVKPPFGYRGLQAADLSSWDSAPTSAVYQILVRDMQQTLGQPVALEPEPCETQPVDPPKEPKPNLGREFTNSIGMTFVLIPAGTFLMGSPAGEEGRSDDERQHQVTISQPFYLQTKPVTQGEWQIVMTNNPSGFQESGADCPVESVSCDDAQEFIRKLNQMEQTNDYRLPTEAEWEYACRAGSTGEFCFGDNVEELENYAWYSENSDRQTNPVGKLKPNAWGLHDLHGNVWEWCQDWYGPYTAEPVVDPKGPDSGESRVLRGGSWLASSRYLRSSMRYDLYPDDRSYDFGFRVARTF